MPPDPTSIEELIQRAFAECTLIFVTLLERERKSGERKQLDIEDVSAVWSDAFDRTVAHRLRQVYNGGGDAPGPPCSGMADPLERTICAWNGGGRAYTRRYLAKIAREAYDESGFGPRVTGKNVADAIEEVVDDTREKMARRGIREVWCEGL